jgi:hypothetical protein
LIADRLSAAGRLSAAAEVPTQEVYRDLNSLTQQRHYLFDNASPAEVTKKSFDFQENSSLTKKALGFF